MYVNCVRVVSTNSKHRDCAACRARYRYWDNKSVADRLKRRMRLELSAETMREFVSDTKLRAHEKKLHRKEVKEHATQAQNQA